jgi:hypothetical protein
MAKKPLICIFALAAILLPSEVAAFDRWDNLRGIGRGRYDVFAERVYEGTVSSKGRVVDGLMYFVLRTSDRIVEVEIGPEEFVARNGFTLKTGDMITVVGMPLARNGRDIVRAREVRTMTSVLVVRDRNGYPMWETNRPVQMDPEIVNQRQMLTLRW